MIGKIIYIVGDLHGDFTSLNFLINQKIRLNRNLRAIAEDWKRRGDDFGVVILQCGDFAWFWPGCDSRGAIKNQISFLDGGFVPIYWCAGNHENHDKLDNLFRPGSEADRTGIVEVDHSVFYCRFGATLRIMPKINVLFAGGAESGDKDWRLGEMAKGTP